MKAWYKDFSKLEMEDQLSYEYQLEWYPTVKTDEIISQILYPYYKQAKLSFLSTYIKHKGLDVNWGYNTNPYVEYKGKAYFLMLNTVEACENTAIQCKEPWEHESIREVAYQLDKVKRDLEYLCLYSRVCFRQVFDRYKSDYEISLVKYVSPMLLKGNSNLSCFLEDLAQFERPENSDALNKAEDILTFYIGYNLVCST